jgi:hypothetical protein
MSLQHKPLDQITRGDIDALIAGAVPEGRTIDYKQTIPHSRDERGMNSFCFDVCAFANAAGGDILYGVPESPDTDGRPTGTPLAPEGIEGVNFDQERLRLEQVVRSRIQPRVPGIQFARVEGDKGPIFILRIPQSWMSPHMVVKDEWVTFYSRGTAGNYRLDSTQIREAFAAGEGIERKVRAFRDDRLSKIIVGETPVELTSDAKLVLHLVPLTMATRPKQYSLERIEYHRIVTPELRQISTYQPKTQWRHNLDGMLVWKEGQQLLGNNTIGGRSCRSYVQWFRNGSLEAVAGLDSPSGKRLPERLEGDLRECFEHYVTTLKTLRVIPPVSVMVTLIRVKGWMLQTRPNAIPFEVMATSVTRPFDRDMMLLPDVLLDTLDDEPTASVGSKFTPILDALWQAGGWPRFYE